VSVGADVLHEGPGAGTPQVTEVAARSPLQLFWRRLREDKVALGALAFIVLLVLLAFPLAPVLLDVFGLPGPTVQNLKLTDSFGDPFGPSGAHPFGVDDLGRDVFARVLYGARASLLVALVATLISVIIGVVLGMMAGFFRGWADTLISRVIDVLLAFPILLLGIGLASSCSLGSGCMSAGGLELVLVVVAAAVGLAAAAGEAVLAVATTAAYMLVAFGFPSLASRLPRPRTARTTARVTYLDGRGVLREAIAVCTHSGFSVADIATQRLDPGEGAEPGTVTVRLELQGVGDAEALRAALAELDGVLAASVDRPDDAE
jgi:hypothetical protein